MPPWKPEAGFGKFQHERRLSDEQIALLDAWAKAGAPEGNPKDKPPAPSFAAGWQGGEPAESSRRAKDSTCLPRAPTIISASCSLSTTNRNPIFRLPSSGPATEAWSTTA